jgi:hypothetical protein
MNQGRLRINEVIDLTAIFVYITWSWRHFRQQKGTVNTKMAFIAENILLIICYKKCV